MNIYDSELAALLGVLQEADEMAGPRGSDMQEVVCDCCDCKETYVRYWFPWKKFVNYARCSSCAALKWYREQMELYGRVLH